MTGDAMAWPFIGNPRAVGALQKAVASGGVQHAYLFSGPRHTGRATAARILAQALNCTSEAVPCSECAQCRRITAGIHSDVQTVTIEETAEEAAARKAITVDQIRSVEASVALKAYEGRTRVVIIDPAEGMTEAAQGAFLKTLEEPPPDVVFILICSNQKAMLETIRSRCAVIDFRLAPFVDIEAALIADGVELQRAALLTRLAAGRPGWAIAAATDPGVLARRSDALQTARGLPEMNLPDRIDLAEKMSDAFKRDREPVLHTMTEWCSWWRDILLAQEGAEDGIANIDLLPDIYADSRRFSQRAVSLFLDSLLQTSTYLRENVQSKIALDALMLDVPAPQPEPAHL